jgi:hypothetical protein
MNKNMTIQEIRDNISYGDKIIAADRFECTTRYVDMILDDERNQFTELAQSILGELEFLATLNIIISSAKKREACQIGEVVFAEPFEPKHRPEVARTMKIAKALEKAKSKLSDQNKAA